MDFGSLLAQLNNENRLLVRKLEKASIKLSNAITSVDFNKTCITNGLLPNYTYCRQASSGRITTNERKKYLEVELLKKEKLTDELRHEVLTLRQRWEDQNVADELRTRINDALFHITAKHRSESNEKARRKLAALYGAPVEVPRNNDQFINLSNVTLTEKQKKFLNLGLNCHYKTRPKPTAKRIELEILLNDIQRLQRDNKITTSPDIQAEFIREANTTRGHHRSALLTPELRTAAEELKNNDNIIIRKADKSNIFVILSKQDYMNKITAILSDNTKFKKITKNPTNELKTRLNRIIRRNNSSNGNPKLPLIEGDHKLGYAYGNIKTHKQGYPLRPIISQIPSVTYTLAKCLNNLIAPYTPASHSLKSSQEFIEILKASRPSGIIASVDVESLFTNVPVDETIELICDRLYRSEEGLFPIPEDTIRPLLQACTKEAPFYGPDGHMYVQTDGVAMGSPLGVLFANYYMGSLEEKIFSQQPQRKPHIYARYVDDIFINVSTEEEVSQLIEIFKENSSLNLTREMESNKRLPFLDVLVQRNSDSFSTEVYTKSTNLGFCLNGASECPERYRRSVINSFVGRALTHCSSWNGTNAELRRVSQILTNNGYPKKDIDDVIRHRLDNFMTPPPPKEKNQELRIYYKNYMSSAYKEDEKAMKKLINENVKPTDADTEIRFTIYYKTRRTSSLVIRNSCLPPTSPMQEVGVVYHYKCKIGDCSHLQHGYIGSTTTTLSKRLTSHLQDGAIRRHSLRNHGSSPTRQQLEENTNIIHHETNKTRLRMAEAVFIHLHKPQINIQLLPESSLPSHRRSEAAS